MDGAALCPFCCLQAIAINLILTLGVLTVLKKSGRPFSCYGIFFDDIFVEIGWGVLAGTAWNFFLQGRIFPASISFARILLLILIAVSEELIWRGYLLETLREITGRPGYAVFLAALGFSCLHAIDIIDPLQLAAAFVLGLLWGFLRLRKNSSLFFCMTMHFLIDLI